MSVERVLPLILLSIAAPALAAAPERIVYNRDVRPILSDNCFYCHGPDKNHRDGKFRLDERESAVTKKAIVPGKPGESEMIARIFTADEDEVMPPVKTHKKLTAEQKELLKRWVAEGAEYQAHWAYITPTRPVVPAVGDSKWIRNPIDAFVLHELEVRKLAPSKEADRRTLLRRLSLDLIGLPPTPAEVEAFVKDASPDAYDKQVERLLASPHYGERMAVPWLDVVRFADTVGYHGDQNQNVFPYRDYVINAFNANKPFDQFTIEQLAGDLLPNPTTEQLVATGFNRLNMMTREGGAQPKEYLAKYQADRVRTVGTAFLGSTFGCAECHDHKFDPITTADFYSLSAYFADVKQWGVYTDYSYTPNPDLKGFNNDYPFPPEIVVDSPYLQRRKAKLEKQLARTLAELPAAALGDDPAKRSSFDEWKRATRAFLESHPSGWVTANPIEPLPKHGKVEADGGVVVLSGGMSEDRLAFELPPGQIATVRLELLPHASNGNTIARTKVDAYESPSVNVEARLSRRGGRDEKLSFARADADHKDPHYSNGFADVDVLNGWVTSAENLKSRQTAEYVLDAPIVVAEGDAAKLHLSFSRSRIGAIRVSVSPLAPPRPGDDAFARALGKQLDAAGDPSPACVLAHLESTAANPELVKPIREFWREMALCRDGKSPTLVTQAWAPRETRILPRGNWQDDSGPVVQPAPPHFVAHRSKTQSTARQTRLDLAKWIVSAQNPLTSRTVVNRFWKQFFGAGLCNTVDDLGAQGEWPSHPELLDWLAVEFRESGWDVKHVVRLMVTSSTYRQDANLRPGLRATDPANRLLSAQSPRRLEAEFVRDNALFAAGLLNLADVGGPSAKPYQPPGYYENIQFPARDYVPDADDRQYRRGLYMHWQRTFLHPMLANFDAPSREDCTAVRVVSNTPQQALTLLNDPSFVEAARVLAGRVMTEGESDAARLDALFRRVLSREPSARERESLSKFIAEQRRIYASSPDDAAKLVRVGNSPAAATNVDQIELAAWTSGCRVVLNLHEAIVRY